MEKELGFVLRRFLPKSAKISVLTKTQGKIVLVPVPTFMSSRLCPGILISFFVFPFHEYGGLFCAREIEIVIVPIELNFDCLLLMHQILEVCYYFLPSGHYCPEVFDFVYQMFSFFLTRTFSKDRLTLIRKVLIAKLLMLVGFYPKNRFLRGIELFKIQTMVQDGGFVDFFKSLTVQSSEIVQRMSSWQTVTVLEDWISYCLLSHPQAKNFKAITVLGEI